MYKFPGAHILSSWSMESLCLLSSQHKSSIHLQQLLLLTCTNFSESVEFKGHQLLEAAKSCDSAKLKKHITPEIINFQHPLTLESSLVSVVFKVTIQYM